MQIENFSIEELVCPHVYNRHGQTAWDWMDPRLKTFLAWFRAGIGREIYVNNWDSGGKLSQRGLRCNICSLVKDKTLKGLGYNSSHIRFQALDFNVKGMEDKDVVKWLIAHQSDFPVPIRLEYGTVGWIHIDVCTNGDNGKLEMFKP